MMRKNNNRNNNNKHRSGGGGGGRRYGNSGGGGNGGGGNRNDGQNLQRQKHHATQQLGKYSDLARNAQINGDRVDVEYYLQHVDHYTRVLSDIAAIENERHAQVRESQIIPGGPNDPNAQAASSNGDQNHGGGDQGDTGGSGGDSPQQSAPDGGSEGGEFNPNSQPRMSRQPRRHQAPDNGAREANANTTDIPLPGSILPPI